MATLGVIIGTRNRIDILKQCLDALVGKIAAQHQIIVVDAGSTDGTPDYVRQLAGVQLVCDGEPIGQARSLNRVFKTLNTEYLCWISDDNIVQPGMLDLAVDVLERHAEIGLVALKVKDVMGSLANLPYIGGISPAGILTCNQGLIRSQLLEAVDYFDQTFRDYGIDMDLTAKVLIAGFKVVHTKTIAIQHYRNHEHSPGAIENDQRDLRRIAATELYKRKYAGLLAASLPEQLQLAFRNLAWLAVQVIRKILGAQTVLGYNMIDWLNVFHGRYISVFDAWHNKNHAFYLVQHMPDAVSRRVSSKGEPPV